MWGVYRSPRKPHNEEREWGREKRKYNYIVSERKQIITRTGGSNLKTQKTPERNYVAPERMSLIQNGSFLIVHPRTVVTVFMKVDGVENGVVVNVVYFLVKNRAGQYYRASLTLGFILLTENNKKQWMEKQKK